MSGDRIAQADVIVLAGGDGSVTGRLVQVVAKLTSVEMGPYAVIGGLAVSCRLAQAHRATGDVDTLVETTSPTAIQRITASIGHRDPDSGTLTVDGVKVDVIDTQAVDVGDLDGIAGPDRLFVAGHRHALESATVATVVAGTGAEAPSASFPLATPAGLIGTKIHALQTRPERNSPKRSTDLYDIYRLAAAHHEPIVIALRDAPFDLGQLVVEALHETVLDEVIDLVLELAEIGDDERAELKSGGLRVDNQAQWARQYLVWADLLGGSQRGRWALTSNGWSLDLAAQDQNTAYDLFTRLHAERAGTSTKPSPPVDDEDLDEPPDPLDEQESSELALTDALGATVRTLTPAGFRQIREFQGALGPFDRGIFMTTSVFTQQAEEQANSPGYKPIDLIDGGRLIELLVAPNPLTG